MTLLTRLRSMLKMKRKSPSPRRKSPSPRRKSPSPRRKSPSVKRSGALGANWYGGRNYIGRPNGPLMRRVRST